MCMKLPSSAATDNYESAGERDRGERQRQPMRLPDISGKGRSRARAGTSCSSSRDRRSTQGQLETQPSRFESETHFQRFNLCLLCGATHVAGTPLRSPSSGMLHATARVEGTQAAEQRSSRADARARATALGRELQLKSHNISCPCCTRTHRTHPPHSSFPSPAAGAVVAACCMPHAA